MTFKTDAPTLDVLGVTRTWGRKAVRYMAKRGLPAFYDAEQQALRAFEFKHGSAWTYERMHEALKATR